MAAPRNGKVSVGYLCLQLQKNMFANCCSWAVEWVGLWPKKRLRNTPPHQNRSQKLKHSTGGLRFRGVVARRPQKTHTCSALFLFCPPNGVTHTHMHTHREGAEPVEQLASDHTHTRKLQENESKQNYKNNKRHVWWGG